MNSEQAEAVERLRNFKAEIVDDVRELRRLLKIASRDAVWSGMAARAIEIDSALTRTAHYEPAADR